MSEIERTEPYSVEVEQATLGSLLRDNSKIEVIAPELEPEHFWDALHQRIFAMTVHLITEGPVTPLILHAVMKHDAGLREVGGLDYLAGLAQSAPANPNLLRHASILRELAARRELIRISQDLAESAYEGLVDRPAHVIAAEGAEALIRSSTSLRKPSVTPYEAAMSTLKDIERRAAQEAVPMVKTGIDKLDAEIGGLGGADLIVIPGASGMGKSSLLGGIALRTALRGVPTIFFSLEMTQRQLVDRMVCDLDFDNCIKPLWYSKFRSGDVKEEEFSRYAAAMQKLHGLPLEIVEEDDLTIEQIGLRARAFSAKHGHKLGIVILDYLQIVSPSEATRGRNREQEVAHIARGAKKLAKMLNWPVVAGSQMNEGAEGRGGDEGRRPRPGDVRESKAIRNEADMMFSPYRQAHFLEDKKPGSFATEEDHIKWKGDLAACRHSLELITLKNRHGRRFDLDLYCDMAASAIRDEAPWRPMPGSSQAAIDFDNPVTAPGYGQHK